MVGGWVWVTSPPESKGIEPSSSWSTGRRAAPREPMRELYVILFNYAPPPLRPRGAHATGGGISDFRFQNSDFRFQISDPNTRQTDFSFLREISDVRFQIPEGTMAEISTGNRILNAQNTFQDLITDFCATQISDFRSQNWPDF